MISQEEQKVEAMAAKWHSKVVLLQKSPDLKAEIKKYFLETYSVYELLFTMLPSSKSYYIRAEPLRHPLIFYYGHTAAAYMNRLMDQGLVTKHINKKFETMLAIGVDERDWDDMNDEHYDWPTLQEVIQFRAQVKQVVLKTLDECKTATVETWKSALWPFVMAIEHQRLHLQTSSPIMRNLPLKMIQPVPELPECPYRTNDINNIPKNGMVQIQPWKGEWKNKSTDRPEAYGWDNEFGERNFDVKAFKASRMLVSNGEYMEFIKDGGYQKADYWDDAGKRWLKSKNEMPRFWRRNGDKWVLRTMSREIDMPWDWPVEVNNLEGRAFCRWKTEKTGKYTRLPTEDEYMSMRSQNVPDDGPHWEYRSRGNINFEWWLSACPVNMFRQGELCDIVGNVWQHTVTPQYPYKGFKINHLWQDFTTPEFHDTHDLLKGGSFVTTGGSALVNYRVGFRRHFYQFAGIRYVQDCDEIEHDIHPQNMVSDTQLEMNLKHHYFNKKSYVMELANKVRDETADNVQHRKVLVSCCSTGRVPFQMGKIFGESLGIDYTTRYFEMSTALKQKGEYTLKDMHINLAQMGLSTKNVSFMQANPQNPDPLKINNFDWVIIDGFSLREGKIGQVLQQTTKLIAPNAHIMVLSVSKINELTPNEGKIILTQNIDEGMIQVRSSTELQASKEDQSYLPTKQKGLTFTLTHYQIVQLQ